MAYLAGYCTLVFANINNKSSEWSRKSEADKNYAITFGRIYIDKTYTCIDPDDNEIWDWDTEDYTTIPDEVQKANAILAEQFVLGNLTSTEPKLSGPIVKKRVKAGSVESETIYKGYYSTSSKFQDIQPEVTMLLSPYCSFGSNSQNLIRV